MFNFLVNLLAGLTAYPDQPPKPALDPEDKGWSALPPTAFQAIELTLTNHPKLLIQNPTSQSVRFHTGFTPEILYKKAPGLQQCRQLEPTIQDKYLRQILSANLLNQGVLQSSTVVNFSQSIFLDRRTNACIGTIEKQTHDCNHAKARNRPDNPQRNSAI
ncbi:hypothetical protein O77CONTIG1_00163 [Leptolyngbya sp. O-77]|nr:hypothetical protein O77CONTIG1_00163 [Leptolyngbya sp. O-77]